MNCSPAIRGPPFFSLSGVAHTVTTRKACRARAHERMSEARPGTESEKLHSDSEVCFDAVRHVIQVFCEDWCQQKQ